MHKISGINQSGAIQILVHLLPKAECLNAHWFLTLDDARQKMEHWRRDLYEVEFVNPLLYAQKYIVRDVATAW